MNVVAQNDLRGSCVDCALCFLYFSKMNAVPPSSLKTTVSRNKYKK